MKHEESKLFIDCEDFRDSEGGMKCGVCDKECYLTVEDREMYGEHPDLKEDFSGEDLQVEVDAVQEFLDEGRRDVLDAYNMSGDYYFQKG